MKILRKGKDKALVQGFTFESFGSFTNGRTFFTVPISALSAYEATMNVALRTRMVPTASTRGLLLSMLFLSIGFIIRHVISASSRRNIFEFAEISPRGFLGCKNLEKMVEMRKTNMKGPFSGPSTSRLLESLHSDSEIQFLRRDDVHALVLEDQ